MKTKRPATAAARKLLTKLRALASNPGTVAEGAAATAKLKRLINRYDFAQKESKEHLFAGRYDRSVNAVPLMELDDLAIASWVKWAIEHATGIRCVFRGQVLLAEATPRSAERLGQIGNTICASFRQLWARFQTFPTITPGDREMFMRGLYDGMMDERKAVGELLPNRADHTTRKPNRKAVARLAGIALHPYAVAVGLGEELRFNKPIEDVTNRLEAIRPKQLAENTIKTRYGTP